MVKNYYPMTPENHLPPTEIIIQSPTKAKPSIVQYPTKYPKITYPIETILITKLINNNQ